MSPVERKDVLDSFSLCKMNQTCIREIDLLVVKPGEHVLDTWDIVVCKWKQGNVARGQTRK